MESAKESDESDADFLFPNKEKPTELAGEIDENIKSFAESDQNTANNNASSVDETADGNVDDCSKFKDTSISGDKSDDLSDIDDVEVKGYLNNEKETRLKKIIWEEMNRQYLEERAAKMEVKSKPRKDRRQKQDPPAQTSAEAAHQMLNKKRLSSKINFDALEKYVSEDVGPSKKTKASNDDEEDDKTSPGNKQVMIYKENESGEEVVDEEGYEFDAQEPGLDWQFEEECYDYGYDDDFDQF